MDNGTTGNNNNRQANTMNQGSQPGSMIRNMMLSASARSANASTGARQHEVTINSTTYRSVNATVRYRISQQGSDNQARVVTPADAHLCSTLTLHVYCLLRHVSTCVYMAYSYTSA